jgi:hypothetical protein
MIEMIQFEGAASEEIRWRTESNQDNISNTYLWMSTTSEAPILHIQEFDQYPYN